MCMEIWPNIQENLEPYTSHLHKDTTVTITKLKLIQMILCDNVNAGQGTGWLKHAEVLPVHPGIWTSRRLPHSPSHPHVHAQLLAFSCRPAANVLMYSAMKRWG